MMFAYGPSSTAQATYAWWPRAAFLAVARVRGTFHAVGTATHEQVAAGSRLVIIGALGARLFVFGLFVLLPSPPTFFPFAFVPPPLVVVCYWPNFSFFSFLYTPTLPSAAPPPVRCWCLLLVGWLFCSLFAVASPPPPPFSSPPPDLLLRVVGRCVLSCRCSLGCLLVGVVYCGYYGCC